MNLGNCPKCGKRMLHARIESIVGIVENESKARCLSFCCIHCNAVLGVQLDPRGKRRTKQDATTTATTAKPVKPA